MTDADLLARLLHLRGLLDQLGDKLWSMKLDLGRLARSTRVIGLGSYAHGYLWLLKVMWMNGGYLPDNDAVIASLMRLSVKDWKRTYKPKLMPMLTRLPDSAFGHILVKPRLVEIMIETANLALENRGRAANAAKARWGNKPAKTKQAPSAKQSSEHEPPPMHGAMPEEMLKQSPSNASKDKDKALLSSSRELYPSPPYPQTPNGLAEGSAGTGSPGLVGRSPPQPSEVLKPTPALLATPLVKKARTGLMAALDSEEDIDE
jgi:uncharacterized protein YdaU (DUF1376 family)